MPPSNQDRLQKDPLEKRPTIWQVAERAGVSIATVSRALGKSGGVSPELVAKVQEAVQALDYHPNHVARNLRKRVAKTIGVIVSDIQNPFFPSVIHGIEKTLVGAGYVLLFGNSDEDPKREKAHLSTLLAEGVAGIILAPTQTEPGYYDSLLELRPPVVAIDRIPSRLSMDTVSVTNKAGAFTATEHLASLGHQRIGLISGPAQLSTSLERLEGFEEAIRAYHLPNQPEFRQFSDFRQAGGYRAMQALLNLPIPPTAVLVANNLMTLGALQAIHERNLKIPEQIALVGFDDMPWATSLLPPLTAIAQPTYELGVIAAQLLLDRLLDPGLPFRHVVLETKLMVRASCGSSKSTQSLPTNRDFVY